MSAALTNRIAIRAYTRGSYPPRLNDWAEFVRRQGRRQLSYHPGWLAVLGRADDTIVTGGKNVAPAEVEQALLEHPAVADAAVHGHEDPEWQEAVVATVVLADATEVTEDDLREFCRERLAPHKIPKGVTFTRELPRNAQGKLQRDKLR